MAGEKPNQTVTTEYLQKALRRRMPKSGAIREELLKFDDTGVVPEYATVMEDRGRFLLIMILSTR